MFNVVKVKRLTETAKIPTRSHSNDAGADLYADISSPVFIYPGCRKLIPTGIAINLPSYVVVVNGMEFVYEAQVRPRSGLALKQGLSVCNSPGTIDA